MPDNLGPDAAIAGRALETVLSHPRVARDADERCFEALLRRALGVVPGLSEVFGLPEGLRYEFGLRTAQPDVAATDTEGRYVGGIEVKIRSNFNVNVSGSQFDTYAAGALAGCRLAVLVADDVAAGKFCARLAADGATSADRWNTVTLATLHDAVIKAVVDVPGIDNATALLVLSLVRLI
ncbi:MAG: hypothetical protein ACRDOD_07985 [Streptosporangiaceae bacterium]